MGATSQLQATSSTTTLTEPVRLRSRSALADIFEKAQALGFIGPAAIERQVAHAEALVAALFELLDGRDGTATGGSMLGDLGSGGGLPGLVLAERLPPTARACLIEASERRSAFLESATRRLGLEDSVLVLACRAEVLGRDPSFRGQLSGITARSFGPPAMTAECAAPLLRIGGVLVVSDPPSTALAPNAPDRWPPDGLDTLGLSVVERRRTPGLSLTILRRSGSCPDRYPRRSGIPTKRPLF